MSTFLEEERAYGTRFLWLPVGVAIGAIFYFQLDFEPSLNKSLAASLLLALLAYLLRRLPVAAFTGVALLTISLGIVFAKIETMRLDTKFISQTIILPLTVRILSWEEQEQGSHQLIVQVITAPRRDNQLTGRKIRLSARSLPDDITIGAGLSGLVSLRPPSGPIRVGAYDFGFHAFYRGLSAQGFFMGQPQRVDMSPPQGLIEQLALAMADLRVTIGKRIGKKLPGEAGAIARALITGQRGGISTETNQALRLSGLAHILSISGLHMAMVTGMVLLLGRFILGLFILFSSRHAPKKIAAFAALVFASFYLLLSGADIAAQRSFIMVAVMLLAVLCDRAAITMRNLALAALIILILTPHEILSPSFQMSFAATAALIAVFSWWSERQTHNNSRQKNGLMWRFLLLPTLSTLAASLVAGSASGIFAAYHFANVAPLGLISNVVALPLMSLLVMPQALIATVLMPFGLEILPLHVMAVGIEGIKMISFWVSSLTPNINPGLVLPHVLLLLSLALIILLFMHSRLRLVALVPLVASLCCYLLTPHPLVLIDENGNLVALSTVSGKVAVSRSRPNAFILNQWLPVFDKGRDDILLPDQDEDGFVCHGLTCQATMADGRIFAMSVGVSGHNDSCLVGDIVLLNYISSASEQCSYSYQTISLRDLARSGAAMIYPTPDGYRIEWAQGASLRPWNAHRYQSKTALGFP